MTDDVVAELRNWVTDWNGAAMVRGEPPRDGIHCDVLYDAIDEIVALRRIVNGLVASGARAAALEEAAQACVGSGAIVAEARLCASAIRALKGQAR